jgi:hypothetical protein
MNPHTYAAYERDPDSPSKSIDLDFEHAREWSDALDVRWEWLLEGHGLPWRDDNGERAKRLIESVPADRQEAVLQALELLIGTGTNG